jgi:hypothetical protein
VTLGLLLAACSGGDGGNGGTDDAGTVEGTDSGTIVSPGKDAGTVVPGKDAGTPAKDAGPMSCAPKCAIGAACKADTDCASGACGADGKCATGATDGKKDFGESDIDCGGATTDMAPKCALGKNCVTNADCMNDACGVGKTCATSAASDGIQNNGESDVDCGGNTTDGAPKCVNGKMCVLDNDCTSGACSVGGICTTGATDGKKDFGESAIDCGGNTTDMAPTCDVGFGCALNNDCTSTYCSAGLLCVANGYTDGKKDFGESDIDCGGHSLDGAPVCADGLSCADGTDCVSAYCNPSLKCATPTNNDGIKNGTETDIDCGGGAPTNAPACAAGSTCVIGNDCSSGGCNYKGKCADAISCTPQHGGDTCGPTGTDSCCHTLPAAGLPQTTFNGVALATNTIDKYNITAGRMRAFVTATNGQMRTWIANHKPVWWNDTWTPYLPDQLDSGNTGAPNIGDGFYQEVGPYVHPPGAVGANEGCYIQGNGARSYRLPDSVNGKVSPASGFKDPQLWTQDQDDERSMNCVPAYIIAAFCAWDGAHLPTRTQVQYLWNTASGSGKPWGTYAAAPALGNPEGYLFAYDSDPKGGGGFTSAYGAYTSAPSVVGPLAGDNLTNLGWANYNYNYWGGLTRNSNVNHDYTIYIAPPGRFPNGDGKYGHSDLGGNVFNALDFGSGADPNGGGGQVPYNCWSRGGSWQGHPIPFNNTYNSCGVNVPATNKYWAMGGRCAR